MRINYRGFGQAVSLPASFIDPTTKTALVPGAGATPGTWIVIDNSGNEWQWNNQLAAWQTISSGGEITASNPLPIGSTYNGSGGPIVPPGASSSATSSPSSSPVSREASGWIIGSALVLGVIFLWPKKSSAPAATIP